MIINLSNYQKLPKKTLNNDKHGLTVNKFNMSTSPYEETDSPSREEPRVTKIYKLNNRKNFAFNRTTTEGNDIIENKRGGNYDNNKDSSASNNQINFTLPNDKK